MRKLFVYDDDDENDGNDDGDDYWCGDGSDDADDDCDVASSHTLVSPIGFSAI